MSRRCTLSTLIGTLTAAAAGAYAYARWIRPWHRRRGATEDELRMQLPGDELVPEPAWSYTHAITIDAPPEEVWPWLVQTGYGRAGWYTYDWFYEKVGAADFVDGHSADRIIPELQDLKVGERYLIQPQGGFTVVDIEPPRRLVLHEVIDMETGKPAGPQGERPEQLLNMSWAYYLEPVVPAATRLMVHFRGDADLPAVAKEIFGLIIDGGSLVMQPKMLHGIKERAESARKGSAVAGV